MVLAQGEEKQETVTVLCKDGLTMEGVVVTATIAKGEDKVFLSSPPYATTNENGQAVFVIGGMEKGWAEIIFSAEGAAPQSLVIRVVKANQ